MDEKNFLHIDCSNGFDTDFLDPDDIYPFDVKFTEFNRADTDDERIPLDEKASK